jgi:hypothetical protein
MAAGTWIRGPVLITTVQQQGTQKMSNLATYMEGNCVRQACGTKLPTVEASAVC